jgi:transposase
MRRSRNELASLRAENKALRAQVKLLTEKLAEAHRTIEALLARVQELESQLHLNSTNSSRPPSSDGPAVVRPSPPRSSARRRRGGQPGHPGHQRPLIPLAQVQNVVPCKPERCPQCDRPLRGTDPTPSRHQVAEVLPLTPIVTEYQLHELECRACHAKTRAPLPPQAVSALGPRAIALVSLLTTRFRQSKRLSTELLEELFGLQVCAATICRAEQTVSEAVALPVEQARAEVQRQTIVHMDETGWRENKQRSWLWVAATTVAVVFRIATHRSKAVAQEILGKAFAGRLISDRFVAYLWLRACLRQLCWAQLMRDFRSWSERDGPGAEAGAALVRQGNKLFHLWHRFQRGEVTRTELQTRMRRIRRQVEEWLARATHSPDAKVAGMAKEIWQLKAALWTFVEEKSVEPTNNLSERLLRCAVIWRKLCFGTVSAGGSRFVERLFTVHATLALRDENVLEYLTRAVDAYTEHRL